MDKKLAEKILLDTELGYDFMSGKFSETRKFFWRGLEFIADFAKEKDIILDHGCGNGRLLDLILKAKNIRYYGTDPSQRLVEIAREKHGGSVIRFQKTDPIQSTLPFNDEFFNTSYSIAVFHHFPSSEYRQQCAKELYRVTKKGGCVVVTVWNLWQRKYVTKVIKNWYNKIIGESRMDWNDCYISFRDNQGNMFQRFHHAFTKSELEKLFISAGFSIERCGVVNGRNILLIGRK